MHNKLLIVLDTNIFISAILYGGIPGKILELCIIQNQIDIAISPELFAELIGKLKYKFGLSKELLTELQDIFEYSLKYVLPTHTIEICRDSDDNKIIDLAMYCNAKYIITGDNDLLELKSYKEILIIKPKDFLNLL